MRRGTNTLVRPRVSRVEFIVVKSIVCRLNQIDESWSASRISASAAISTPVVVEEEEAVIEESPEQLAKGFRQGVSSVCQQLSRSRLDHYDSGYTMPTVAALESRE
jgi:hypothetical protein